MGFLVLHRHLSRGNAFIDALEACRFFQDAMKAKFYLEKKMATLVKLITRLDIIEEKIE